MKEDENCKIIILAYQHDRWNSSTASNRDSGHRIVESLGEFKAFKEVRFMLFR